jgi:radical SAM ThiC family protein
VQPI